MPRETNMAVGTKNGTIRPEPYLLPAKRAFKLSQVQLYTLSDARAAAGFLLLLSFLPLSRKYGLPSERLI